MVKVLAYLEVVEDRRQAKKVLHKIGDIIALVFFATLANANLWEEIEVFGQEHEEFLRQYLTLPYGIPSHDTIQRVMAIVSPDYLQRFRELWNEMLNSDEGEKIKKILSLDGKTQRGNGNRNQKANHIVSAVDEDGVCLHDTLVDEKTNEIKAIPELLDALNIKDHIITMDAMGTQTEIVKRIRKKRADYVLALKRNHKILFDDIQQYFTDPDLLAKCAYTRKKEKARGGIELREYWQTDDIGWLSQRKEWTGLKSIAMTRNTIVKDGKKTVETRYFISSLALDVELIARAIRGHWMVESHHWHLDVTFKEDANRTLEKQAAFNLNIIRKIALLTLKLFDTGRRKLSLSKKRFLIGTNPERHLQSILSL